MILALLLAAAPCQPPAPDAPVRVTFPAGSTLDDLDRFAVDVLCQPKGAGGKRPLTLTVGGTVYGRQLPSLIRLLAESADGSSAADLPPATVCTVPPGSIVPVDSWTRKIAAAAREQLIACSENQVRIVPSFVEGKAEGFKLFAIRQGSVVEQLGFQNGDVVTAVNGASVATPQEALAAAALFKTATEVKLTVRRAGSPRTITWLVR